MIAKGLVIVWLPGWLSENVLIWDKIRIHIYRMKHGKLKIVFLNYREK